MAEQVTRIGRGVPGAPKPPPRRLPLRLWVVGAAFGAVLVFLTAIYVFEDKPHTPAAAASISPATHVECETVRKAYVDWYRDKGELTYVLTDEGTAAYVTASMLNRNAEALVKATSGYPDVPGRDLAGQVAKYKAETMLLELETLGDGKVSAGRHAAAMDAWEKIEDYYAAFMRITCGIS